MTNPWKTIRLDDYEKHMSLDSVRQLQAMNRIMKDQLAEYPVRTVMILGIAGGNGLEHLSIGQFDKVFAVDINENYLITVQERYEHLAGMLDCLHLDLIQEVDGLPQVDFVIANLLIEYIGYPAFQQVIRQAGPAYVSCVIQINAETEGGWVSDSPYIHAFDRLDEVHHQLDEKSLCSAMEEIGYAEAIRSEHPLPNNKKLVRLDFHQSGSAADSK